MARQENDVMCHVWMAPCWQGLFRTPQAWSERPCVRPVDAARITAGHNALRGSGPGQKAAFDNAMALVGCPDLRIDRICITCFSPLPTFTSRWRSEPGNCSLLLRRNHLLWRRRRDLRTPTHWLFEVVVASIPPKIPPLAATCRHWVVAVHSCLGMWIP